MHQTVFFELEFLGLVLSSILLPVGIFIFLMKRDAIARGAVLFFASLLIALSAVDVFLLQHLARRVKQTPSLVDDQLFASEVSMALYVLPAVFAGIAVNLISHLIIAHLQRAERRFDRAHPTPREH